MRRRCGIAVIRDGGCFLETCSRDRGGCGAQFCGWCFRANCSSVLCEYSLFPIFGRTLHQTWEDAMRLRKERAVLAFLAPLPVAARATVLDTLRGDDELAAILSELRVPEGGTGHGPRVEGVDPVGVAAVRRRLARYGPPGGGGHFAALPRWVRRSLLLVAFLAQTCLAFAMMWAGIVALMVAVRVVLEPLDIDWNAVLSDE